MTILKIALGVAIGLLLADALLSWRAEYRARRALRRGMAAVPEVPINWEYFWRAAFKERRSVLASLRNFAVGLLFVTVLAIIFLSLPGK